MEPRLMLADLMRQGFMRRALATPKPVKRPRVTVACDACQNWHTKGKHTKSAADRAAHKAAGGSVAQREVQS